MEAKRHEEKEILRMLDNDASKAMEMIIDKYGGAVKTICKSILLGFTSEDIEETISDVFVALWMARDKIEVTKDCGLKEYLYGIARKTALNRRRKLMRVQSGVSDEEIDDADAAGKLRPSRCGHLQAAAAHLGGRDRRLGRYVHRQSWA